MSQETINLILGAMIGIIPSIILTIINNKQQEKRYLRTRSWQLQDVSFNRNITITETRLTQLEDYATNAIKVCGEIYRQCLSEELAVFGPDKIPDLDYILASDSQIMGIAESLKDKFVIELIAKIALGVSDMYQLRNTIYCNNVNLDMKIDARKMMATHLPQLQTAYGNLICALDSQRKQLTPLKSPIS